MVIIAIFIIDGCYAQDLKSTDVPAVVKSALMKKYPDAKSVSWEKEKGNYEANWGGKSGEDNSVMFTPAGNFIEIVKAIPVSKLPQSVATYVKSHYNNAVIKEAGLVTDAGGKVTYEAEIKGKDLIFDEKGNFIKVD
ncbi:MAG TPA: PepSY-like domain-containing protein [Candidatus Nitrosocosmicus sp.]